jgi:uncharacterized protein YggE
MCSPRAEPVPQERRLLRRLIAAALLAAARLVVAEAVANPISLPPLAPGEVLLEADGVGLVRTPASVATVTATVYGTGDTPEAAQRSLDDAVRQVTEAARSMGATAGDIRLEPSPVGGDLTVFDVVEAPGEARVHQLATQVVIRLRNVGRAAELHRLVSREDPMAPFLGPVYELDDESGPRREARRLALAAARADAEAYAAAAGMRIVRIVRITERAGFGFMALLGTEPGIFEEMMPSMLRLRRGPEVVTRAIVAVDFVLTPR